jgi:hypothetical protein
MKPTGDGIAVPRYTLSVKGTHMRQLLLAGATVAVLASPAFAGSPPTPRPIEITVNPTITTTGGGKVNTTIHAGTLTLTESAVVKGSLLVGASLSVSVQTGFTTP